MASDREVRIPLHGGPPWGWEIDKDGNEIVKTPVVSLHPGGESSGKGECGGTFLYDEYTYSERTSEWPRFITDVSDPEPERPLRWYVRLWRWLR